MTGLVKQIEKINERIRKEKEEASLVCDKHLRMQRNQCFEAGNGSKSWSEED